MDKFITVTTTFADKDDAVRLSEKIVGLKLAACCQIIGPAVSIYWWEDKMQSHEEWICSFKTSADLFQNIEDQIKMMHPYKLPQIIYEDIKGGSREYFEWLGTYIKKG